MLIPTMTVSVSPGKAAVKVQAWCNKINSGRKPRLIEPEVILVAIGSMITSPHPFWVADNRSGFGTRDVDFYSQYVNFSFAEFRQIFLEVTSQ